MNFYGTRTIEPEHQEHFKPLVEKSEYDKLKTCVDDIRAAMDSRISGWVLLTEIEKKINELDGK